MERINFKEVRDLGKVLRDSAQFIRQNFVPLFKASLLYVIVPIIVGGILVGMGTSQMYSNMGNPESISNPFHFIQQLAPGYLLVSIAYMIFYIFCISYIKKYVNGDELLDSSSLFAEVKKHIFKVFLGGIVVVFLVYLGFILCVVPGVYLSIVLAHVFAIAIVEDKSFGKSFSKSFEIIKGKWWDSFILFFVTSIINGAIAFIVILPMYIFMFVNMFSSIKENDPSGAMSSMSSLGWFMPFYILVYLVLTFIIATVVTMNYYSLIEATEGVGEKEDIDSIGM